VRSVATCTNDEHMQAIPQRCRAGPRARDGCRLPAGRTADMALRPRKRPLYAGGQGGCSAPRRWWRWTQHRRKRALEMAMSGDPIDAQTVSRGAGESGRPAEELKAHGRLLERVTRGSALAKGIASRPSSQIGLDQPGPTTTHEVMGRPASCRRPGGIAAFLEKRPRSGAAVPTDASRPVFLLGTDYWSDSWPSSSARSRRRRAGARRGNPVRIQPSSSSASTLLPLDSLGDTTIPSRWPVG